MSTDAHREANARLCQWLGIGGETQHDFSDCQLETYDHGNPWRVGQPKCTCIPKTTYPDLDTREGFWILRERLDAKGLAVNLDSYYGLTRAQLTGVPVATHKDLEAALFAAAVALMEREAGNG